MRPRSVCLALMILSWALGASGETLHFQPGPRLNIRKNVFTLVLHDGRLLTCPSVVPQIQCEIVDPLSGERQAAPSLPGLTRDALALDDGKLFLRNGQLIDPQTGSAEPMPAPTSDLSLGYAKPLSGGRAVFWGDGVSGCHKLRFFLGAKRGYQEVDAAPRGVCVERVFDLGDGEVLIARAPSGEQGKGSLLEFLLLDLDTWAWRLGARLPFRVPRAAFRYGDGLLVLLSKKDGEGSELLFLDRSARAPRVAAFAQAGLELESTRRYGANEFLLFTKDGALLWNPVARRLVAVPLRAPPLEQSLVVERGGQVVMIDRDGNNLAFVLTKVAAAARNTPCDQAFAYAEAAVRSGQFGTVDEKELVSAAGRSSGCLDWLDTQDRLPDAIQLPVEALANREVEYATPEEDVAARVLCILNPRFAAPLVERMARTPLLRGQSQLRCHEATEQVPIISAEDKAAAAKALLGAAFQLGSASLQAWVSPLLESRERLRRAAGPLLLEAKARRSSRFDQLRLAVCIPLPTPGLEAACAEVEPYRERAWRDEEQRRARSSELRRVWTNFGIATGVIGGLGTLAYLDRNGNGSRVIAIGSGATMGAVLGAGLALASAGRGGDTSGLGGLLLAIPLGIAGGVAGGLVAAQVASEPGDARFAAAAVPLSAAWLMSVGFTIDAL